MNKNKIATYVGQYFQEYLVKQRRISRNTIHSYRDAWKLYLSYCSKKTGKPVERLSINDIDDKLVLGFLDDITNKRNNKMSTRNIRLAAIRSFFRWLAMEKPDYLKTCSQVISIKKNREKSSEISYLERDEFDTLLNTVDLNSRYGIRNYTLLALLYNTGARVQEILNLRISDIQIESPFLVNLIGKGNKERICTLWPETVDWIKELIKNRRLPASSDEYLFINKYQRPMTRHGVRYILKNIGQLASEQCSSLKKKKIHPHIIRHTAAMHMLQAGIDLVTIQSILGHTSIETTNKYVSADLKMKKEALEKCEPINGKPVEPKWKTSPDVIAFLSSL